MWRAFNVTRNPYSLCDIRSRVAVSAMKRFASQMRSPIQRAIAVERVMLPQSEFSRQNERVWQWSHFFAKHLTTVLYSFRSWPPQQSDRVKKIAKHAREQRSNETNCALAALVLNEFECEWMCVIFSRFGQNSIDYCETDGRSITHSIFICCTW